MLILTLDQNGALAHEGVVIGDMRARFPQEDLLYFFDRHKAQDRRACPLEVTIRMSRSADGAYCERFFELTEKLHLKTTIELGTLEEQEH